MIPIEIEAKKKSGGYQGNDVKTVQDTKLCSKPSNRNSGVQPSISLGQPIDSNGSNNTNFCPSQNFKTLLVDAFNKLPQIDKVAGDVKDFLTSYSSSGKNISFIVKNPDKDDAIKERLSLMGISPQQLRTVSSNSTEYKYVYSAIVIEYLGNSETIPFTMSSASF